MLNLKVTLHLSKAFPEQCVETPSQGRVGLGQACWSLLQTAGRERRGRDGRVREMRRLDILLTISR